MTRDQDMFSYTPDELQAIVDKGIALGKEIDYLILTKPRNTVTMGMVITAVAYLFATRAEDKNHVALLARDIATAINSLHDQRTPRK